MKTDQRTHLCKVGGDFTRLQRSKTFLGFWFLLMHLSGRNRHSERKRRTAPPPPFLCPPPPPQPKTHPQKYCPHGSQSRATPMPSRDRPVHDHNLRLPSCISTSEQLHVLEDPTPSPALRLRFTSKPTTHGESSRTPTPKSSKSSTATRHAGARIRSLPAPIQTGPPRRPQDATAAPA